MKKEVYEAARKRALEYYEKAHIVLTESEKENLEVADLGLGHLEETGLEIVTYINTEKCCAKEMVLFPYQTCPEHRHKPLGDYPGKEETFRVRYGTCYLYVEGEPCANPVAKPPERDKEYYTVWHEIKLEPGQQYTLYPDTKHWFQAGSEGAVISEFSTRSYDEYDIFTNPNIKRLPEVE